MKDIFFLVLIYQVYNVYCHSQPSCIKKLNKTTCVGFPRYYNFNNLPIPLPSSDSEDQFFSSRDRQNLIQPGINTICPELPIDAYTTNFPMASAFPGETLTLQHPPRGHSSQPSSDVWIYMHPSPNMYPTNKQLNSSDFKLIGQYPFNNCSGLSKELSWANCTGKITLPQNLTSGIYTFWWRWNLNEIPYSDCFEINVQNSNTTRLPVPQLSPSPTSTTSTSSPYPSSLSIRNKIKKQLDHIEDYHIHK